VGVTIIGVLVAYEVFHLITQLTITRWRGLTSEGKESIIRVFILAINGLFYILMRRAVIGEVMQVGKDVFRHLENPIAFTEPGLTKVLSIAWINVYYLGLLVFPLSQSCDYSFDCIPLVTSPLSDPRVIIMALVLLSTMVVALRAVYSGVVGQHFELATGLTWLILPFLPSTHIFLEIGTLVAERLLYLPSIGYCLLLAYALDNLIQFMSGDEPAAPVVAAPSTPGGKKKKGEGQGEPLLKLSAGDKNLLSVALVLVAVFFGLLVARNIDWHNDESRSPPVIRLFRCSFCLNAVLFFVFSFDSRPLPGRAQGVPPECQGPLQPRDS